jgi:hypothetical protein
MGSLLVQVFCSIRRLEQTTNLLVGFAHGQNNPMPQNESANNFHKLKIIVLHVNSTYLLGFLKGFGFCFALGIVVPPY